jgi:hypothetical protein
MVIGATLFGWSDADAVLCVKSKKGVIAKVTIRDDACKKKESVGDPSILLGLPTTTTSPTTTTTLAPSRRASRIVDSAGNQVAWVAISPLGNSANGVWALQAIDGRAIVFPMNSNGPILDAVEQAGAQVDDFQHQFVHQGMQCAGDRFALTFDLLNLIIGSDLMSVAYPSTDGKTGYVTTLETTPVSFGFISGEFLNYQCATPGDPAFPPTVDCGEGAETDPPVVAVTRAGSPFPCDANKLGQGADPTTECMCIRCCSTRVVAPPDPQISLFRVLTVDLGLGNSTPPYRIEP